MLHDNDLRSLDALLVTIQARQFDCRLVGFSSRVGKEDPVQIE
jgi:hypothetical protein